MSYKGTRAKKVVTIICPLCNRGVESCGKCDRELNPDCYYCDNCKAIDYHLCPLCESEVVEQ